MKIGIFISFGIGGADKSMYILIKGFREYFSDHTFIYFYNKYSLPNPNIDKDLQVSRYSLYKGIDINNLENVKDLNNYGLDIFLLTRGGDEFWLLPNFENTQFNFKVVEINFHGILKTKADLRIFPSDELINFRNLYSTNHRVIYNPTLPSITNTNLRKKLNIENKFVCGRIARADIEIYSNYNLLAYKNIEDENTVFLYVNPSNKAIEDSKLLGIKNIIFLNPTFNDFELSEIYNTFDVLCHSNNLGETFGNTIAEAMIHGIPVISHKGSDHYPQAQRELLKDFLEYYIETDIVNNYTKKILCLKNDETLRLNISNKMKDYALRNFEYSKICKIYINTLKEYFFI